MENRYYDTYKNLTTDTYGVLANINENFSSAFLLIVVNIGVDTNSSRWVGLSNGKVVKLDADPSIGDIDIDGDGASDLYDINPCKYDITAEIKENETIKFNTGNVGNYCK